MIKRKSLRRMISLGMLVALSIPPVQTSPKTADAATIKYVKVGKFCYISDKKLIKKVIVNGSLAYNKKPQKKLKFKIKAGKYKITYFNKIGKKYTVIYWGDSTKPKINVNNTGQSITVSVKDNTKLDTVLLNGRNVKSDFTISTPGDYTITAKDKAGNTTTKTVTLEAPAIKATDCPPTASPYVSVKTTEAPNTTPSVTQSASLPETQTTASPVATIFTQTQATERPIISDATQPSTAPAETIKKAMITLVGEELKGATIQIKDSANKTVVTENASSITYTSPNTLVAGLYTVTITKDGYETYNDKIEVNAASSAPYNVKLIKVTPKLMKATATKCRTVELQFDQSINQTTEKKFFIDGVQIPNDNIVINTSDSKIATVTLPVVQRIKSYTTNRTIKMSCKVADGTTRDTQAYVTINKGIIPDVPQPDGGISHEGTYGNTKWKIYKNGLLEITGTGNMNDHTLATGTPWYSVKDEIKYARVEVSGAMYALFLFKDLTNLEKVDLTGLDFSTIVNAESMFQGCTKLTSVDTSTMDTSNCQNMCALFRECASLTSVDVSNFNTSKVGQFNLMFYGCQKLTNVDVSKWNVSNATTMHEMFYDCQSLSNINIGSWKPCNVTDMSYMFFNCIGLTGLSAHKLDTSSVTNMELMFWGCKSLKDIDISAWNTASLTTIKGMFRGCESLTSIDLNEWNTSKRRR